MDNKDTKIDTVTVGIRHTGSQAVIVRTYDGSITVHPGDKLKDREILHPTEEQLDIYRDKGVRFTGLPKRDDGPDEAELARLRAAVEDAKAKHAEAQAAAGKQGAGPAEAKAAKEAADALAAAETAMKDAGA